MTARILLAEDNQPLSQMLQRFLAARGFHVLAAKTGTEALLSAVRAALEELPPKEYEQSLTQQIADIYLPMQSLKSCIIPPRENIG